MICKHRVWEKISKHDVSFISRLCEDNSAVKVKQTSARFGLKKCYLFPVAMLQIEFWLMKSHFFIKTRFLTILCFKSGFIFFSIKSKLSFRANNEKSKCWKGLYSQNKWVFLIFTSTCLIHIDVVFVNFIDLYSPSNMHIAFFRYPKTSWFIWAALIKEKFSATSSFNPFCKKILSRLFLVAGNSDVTTLIQRN